MFLLDRRLISICVHYYGAVPEMNSYEKLAATLDKIPNGFPAVEDGTHLKILEWIFTPEEAELASKLKLRGETLDEIAGRLRIPKKKLNQLLTTMLSKGQISSWISKSAGSRKYGLLPFAVGIYEEQLNRMDKEFAQLLEQYFKHGFKKISAIEPVIFKVIPVNQSIRGELEIYPYEQAEQLLENAASWGIRECICKKQKSLLGQPCSYPTTVCMAFVPNREHAFDDDELTKPVTKEESLRLLKQAEEAGLIHCSYNTQTGHYYICNCCTCCCAVLRGVNTLSNPREYIKTDFVISVNADLCTGCGTCIDRCQFRALSVPEDVCVPNTTRCIGCGVCAMVCPESALELIRKEPAEKPPPPENPMDWMTQRAVFRKVDPSDVL
ncbi:MAG: 4Fe-4S ferredoxin [Candidatus Thorarchaeota archaeon]|nr:MAG: 4Fe-4S ferredoxin [Candidatus Thorarchaeota archaeon]